MTWFGDIKSQLFQRKLEAERHRYGPPRAVKQSLNPQTADRIALLFPADSAEDRKAVDKWRDAFGKLKSKVEVVGYFRADVSKASFDLLTLSGKNRNWYGVPTGSAVEDFLKRPCDLLIRLGPVEHRELDYLAALKPASLKVGPHSTRAGNPYHLQYDTTDEHRPADQLGVIARIFTFTNATTKS